jgi:hypothetical protein
VGPAPWEAHRAHLLLLGVPAELALLLLGHSQSQGVAPQALLQALAVRSEAAQVVP